MSKERPFVPDNSPKPGSEELRGEIDKLNKEGWEDNAVVRVVPKGEDAKKQREILETGGECQDLRTYLHLHSEQFASADEVTEALGNRKLDFDKLQDGSFFVRDHHGKGLSKSFSTQQDIRKRILDDISRTSFEKGMVLFSLLYKSKGGQIKCVDIKHDLIKELGTDELRKSNPDLVNRLSSERQKNPPDSYKSGDERHDRWVAENISKFEPMIYAAFNSLERSGFVVSDSLLGYVEKGKEDNFMYYVDLVLRHRESAAEEQAKRKKKKEFEF